MDEYRTITTTDDLDQLFEVTTILDSGDREALMAYVSDQKPVDFALIARDLDAEQLQELTDLLPTAYLAKLTEDADETLRLKIVGAMDNPTLVLVLSHMASDDVADLLGELAHERSCELLANMRFADRTVLTKLMSYPQESAGSIMTTSFIALREDCTVADCLATIRDKCSRTEQIQTLYVLDMHGELLGYLDLRTILTSSRDTEIGSISETRMISIDPYADQEKAADLVARYDLNALPVVSAGQLLGVITVDDIVDVIIAEYDEYMLRLAGANEEETLKTPLKDSVRMRLPWLLVNLVTAFLASFVVKCFEGTIAQIVALSAVMTIISGMGGNAGSQTMAIAVRQLSRDEVTKRQVLRSLAKEASAGVVNGIVNGLVTGLVVAIVYSNAYLPLIVVASMVANMVIAGTFGLLVPVALKALKQDPAVSSSIFVSTATDVLGFLVFLGLA